MVGVAYVTTSVLGINSSVDEFVVIDCDPISLALPKHPTTLFISCQALDILDPV